MFSAGVPGGKSVSTMTRREKEAVFHTHSDLSRVPWVVDMYGRLIPATACEHRYAESAFNNDQAFFLKMVGSVNCAEMELKLVTNPRKRQSDDEMRKTVRDIALRWFKTEVAEMSLEMKSRLVPHLYRSHNTSVSQLARCVGLSQSQVKDYIRR